MATLTVRNLDAVCRDKLKVRAAKSGRSMEAEARVILAEAVASEPDNWFGDWIEAARPWRGALELPERSLPREVGL